MYLIIIHNILQQVILRMRFISVMYLDLAFVIRF